MKIIIRYILKDFLKIFIVCLFIFLTLFFLSETFRILNMNNKSSHALYYLIFYLIFQSPYWITEIMPISILLGFLFSYSNLSNFNEITAIKAGGINLNKIFLPIILFSIFASLLVLASNEYIIPKSNILSNEIYRYKIQNNVKIDNKIYQNINYLGKDNTKYIIKLFDPSKNALFKINIDRFNEGVFLDYQIYASSAVFVGDGKWNFYDGVVRFFNSRNVVSEEVFKNKIINLKEEPSSFAVDDVESNFMNIKDLKKNIQKLKNNSIPVFKELTEMYHKVAFPFANTIVVLIGIAFASSKIKNNKVISFAITIFISFIYWGVTSICINLGAENILQPILAAWLANIIFFIFSFLSILRLKK